MGFTNPVNNVNGKEFMQYQRLSSDPYKVERIIVQQLGLPKIVVVRKEIT